MKIIINFIVFLLILSNLLYSKPYKIAVVLTENIGAYTKAADGYINSLKNKSDFIIEKYNLKKSFQNGIDLAKNLKENKIDLIYAIGQKAAYSLGNFSDNIPVVFSSVLNYKITAKYKNNKIISLVNNNNIAGITLDIPIEITLTQFQMLVPTIKKIGIIYSKKTESKLNEIKPKLKQLGFDLVAYKVNSNKKVKNAFQKIKDKIDVLYMLADVLIYNKETSLYLINAAQENKIPFIAYSDNFVKVGALMSISPSYETIGSQAAVLTEKILIDKKDPADVGIVSPIGSIFVINEKTISQLKLNISQETLSIADKLYTE